MVDQKISIRQAEQGDSNKIADLHIQNIQSGFLSKLGEEALAGIYRFIISDPDSFCYVAEAGERIVGFICATESYNLMFKRFIKNNFLLGLRIAITKIMNFQSIKKTLDHIILPKKRIALPPAELLAIAVDSDFERTGIGKQLFKATKREFVRRKVRGFIAVVGQDLTASKSFMKKMGGIKISEIEVHNGEKSNVYFWS